MGWIARAQLASAVSNAGGMGIIETSSGELDAVQATRSKKMRKLTDKPFGVNVALAFVRDPDIVQFVIDQGVKFVTTSAGDPQKIVAPLKDAGLTVFHVVPSLKAALRAIEGGVDGLVVEGGEGGGFKNPREVATMVLLPLVCEKVTVPVIAAGGIVDGRTMAAAFALGAEGVQMGTRMVSAAESPVHQNWKNAILAAQETDTVFLNRFGPGPALRALRTEKTTRFEKEPPRQHHGRVRQRARPLLRRRHGGLDRALRPGRGPHRRASSRWPRSSPRRWRSSRRRWQGWRAATPECVRRSRRRRVPQG